MRNRRRQFNMSHTFAADFGQRNFHAALFADNAAIFHAFVFAAQALVVFNRTEDAGAEQTVPLRLKCTIVNRLRLFDLAV